MNSNLCIKCGYLMNRLTFNISYWLSNLIAFLLFKFGHDEFEHCYGYYSNYSLCNETNFRMFYSVGLVLLVVAIVIAAFRIKALNRTLWNIVWLFIPIVAFFYALWLGITTNKK